MQDELKLQIVSKNNPLKKEVAKDLIRVPNDLSSGEIEIEREVLDNFINLRNDALKIGVDILIDSGYRSFKRQREIFEMFKKEKGEEYAKTIVAPVGTSEHHTGLAVDLTLRINGIILEDNDDLFENVSLFQKIEPLLNKNGFILRYPEGYEQITGYPYEPWHIRYIGKENALDMQEKHIKTLEEYTEKLIEKSKSR